MTTPARPPHDSTVRAILGQPDVARAFLRAFLPKSLLARIDLSTLEAKPGHFIDPRLGWRATDLLFQVTIDGRPGFLYLLIEHQSTGDRWIVFRLSRTVHLIWDKDRSENPGRRELPIVVPIVLAHAKRRWSGPMQLQQLVADGDLPATVRDKVPSMTYFLCDLRSMTDAQILGIATTASLRLFMLILRNAGNPKLVEMLRGWHGLLEELMREPTALRLIDLLLTYLAKAVPDMTQKTLREVGEMVGLDPEIVPNSLAWKWIQEGHAEGLQKGREEGARRLLLRQARARFPELPPWFEDRIAAASLDELDILSERLLTAPTAEAMFE